MLSYVIYKDWHRAIYVSGIEGMKVCIDDGDHSPSGSRRLFTIYFIKKRRVIIIIGSKYWLY